MVLKGKTALVTGSTSGIGLAMAKAMAAQGANVMMNGFGEKDAAIAEVKAYGVEVDYHGADMSKPDEIAQMIAATENVLEQLMCSLIMLGFSMLRAWKISL